MYTGALIKLHGNEVPVPCNPPQIAEQHTIELSTICDKGVSGQFAVDR
jgi:hypothetical protein